MLYIQWVSYVIVLLVLLIASIDIYPKLRDWFFRIHIGRFNDISLWKEAITDRGAKWLVNTPKISVTDNTRLVFIDILKGNYTRSAIQHWQEASLILGSSEYLKYREDIDVKNTTKKYLDSKFDSSGQWLEQPKHIDAAILAYAIMKIDFIDCNKYKPALDLTWKMIQDHIGSDNTVRYRNFMKSYRYVDTIGFICPFLITYGLKYNKPECIDLAVKQIKEFEAYGMLDRHDIPCHVYKIENKVPIGQYGWGRGLGWYALGLIDSWNELPKNHIFKPVLEQSVKRFAKAAVKFQRVDGSWSWMVTREEARADSSATAALGWFLVNAAQIEEISAVCLDSSNKAIGYLMKVTRRNGAIDFSQGDTKDIGVYSTLFNILPFTQGLAIRTINLMINRKEQKEKWVNLEEVLPRENNGVHSYIQ